MSLTAKNIEQMDLERDAKNAARFGTPKEQQQATLQQFLINMFTNAILTNAQTEI